jgi:hypothetical protein
MLLAVEADEFQPQIEEEGYIGPTAADVDGSSSSENAVGIISGSRRRDEANMFQAFFQMAFAAIMVCPQVYNFFKTSRNGLQVRE